MLGLQFISVGVPLHYSSGPTGSSSSSDRRPGALISPPPRLSSAGSSPGRSAKQWPIQTEAGVSATLTM